MKQKLQDYEVLEIAFDKAQSNGYEMPPLERAIFYNNTEPIRSSLRRWVDGVLVSKEFAKAFFGDEQVDRDGSSLVWLSLWAKQTHYKIKDKLYTADRSRPDFSYYESDITESLYKQASAIAEETIPVNTITQKLEDVYASVAVDTHDIQEPEVRGGVPAWEYHIQRMVMSEDFIGYIRDYLGE